MVNVSHREQIILELVRRLKSALHPIPIIRGYEHAVVEKIPSITIIEMPANSGEDRPNGTYQKTLPLQIQFYAKTLKHADKMPAANIAIENIRSAIELDSHFAIDGNKNNVNKYLCESYREIEVADGISTSDDIVVFILYEFKYYEQHKGFIIEETERTLESIMNYIESPGKPEITQDFEVP